MLDIAVEEIPIVPPPPVTAHCCAPCGKSERRRRRELRRRKEHSEEARYLREMMNLDSTNEDEKVGDDVQDSSDGESTPTTKQADAVITLSDDDDSTADDVSLSQHSVDTTSDSETTSVVGKMPENVEDPKLAWVLPGDTPEDYTMTKLYYQATIEKTTSFWKSFIKALGYLPLLQAREVAVDYEFTDLIENTQKFSSTTSTTLTWSDSTTDCMRSKKLVTSTPSSTEVSELQALYSHYVEVTVDNTIARMAMNDTTLAWGSIISQDGQVSRTVEIMAERVVTAALAQFPNGSRRAHREPQIKINTVLHVMNMFILRGIRVARGRPTGQLLFRRGVSSQ